MADPFDPDPQPPRRRLWPWALLGLATGVLACVVVLNIWNSQLTLTEEKLAAARLRWEGSHVRNYDIRVIVSGNADATYDLSVRGGKVVAAKHNGQPFEQPEKAYPWTVPGLFDVVLQRDLDTDKEPDCPPSYTQVEFDPSDGHPVRYLRTSARHRIQMDVTLTAVP